jgi:predicted AAA+ superfamily ATPase
VAGYSVKQILPRKVRDLIVEALGDTRIVLVTGARQVGKTTLAREISSGPHRLLALTLDDRATRDAAVSDPAGFIAGLAGPVFIDEIQRAPDLLLAIRDDVDRDTSPGRYLLTGSTNLLASKRINDALTGRIEAVRLWPLAQTEIRGGTANFIDALRRAAPPIVTDAPVGRAALRGFLAAGGYPEARLREGRRRDRWFESLLATALDRDLRDISDAIKTEAMPGLLRLLASQAAKLVSYRAIGTRLDLHHATVKSYVGLLEQMFLVRRLPAWRPGLGAREVRAPKIYLVDTGLMAHLMGASDERIAADDQVTGKIVENFAAMELTKHAEWAAETVRLHHYQREREDVDLVAEWNDGSIAAIEVKSRATVRAGDWKWVARLRDQRKHRFVAGVVLYTGAQTIPLGDRLWAVPLSALWA